MGGVQGLRRRADGGTEDDRDRIRAYQEADRDRILWLSFVRSVETADGVGWHVGYVFSRSAPASLVGVHDYKWWWPEDSALPAWFADVESGAVLRECLALDGWKWEGFSD